MDLRKKEGRKSSEIARLASANLVEEHLQSGNLLKVLGAPRGSFGTDYVLKGRDGYDNWLKIHLDSFAYQILIPCGAGREKGDVEIAETGDQVQQIHPSKEPRVNGKRDALGSVGRPDLGFHVPERRCEELEVPGLPRGTDVDIAGAQIGAVQRGGNAADHHILHLMLIESSEDLFRLEAGHGDD
jgi:hypothetical protein